MPAPRGTFIRYNVMTHESSGGVLQRRESAGTRRNIRCLTTASTRSSARGATMVAGLMEIEAAPSGLPTSIGE